MSSKIQDGLFMGDVDAAQDIDFIELNMIEYIINCSGKEVPNVFERDGIQYISLDMEKNPYEVFFDLKNNQFTDTMEFIREILDQSLSLLVHSYDGINRSPSLMIAYLMYSFGWGVDKAYELVISKRNDIKPHARYVEQLYKLQNQIMREKNDSSENINRRLNDWVATSEDLSYEETLLVNTYLNSGEEGLARKDPHASEKITQCSHSRNIRWIDQQKNLPRIAEHRMKCQRTKHIIPERPPNASYSSMHPENGWIDTLPLEPRALTYDDVSNAYNSTNAEKEKQSHSHSSSFTKRSILKDTILSSDDEEDDELESEEKREEFNNSSGKKQKAFHEDESWDLSYSDPCVGKDLDYMFPSKGGLSRQNNTENDRYHKSNQTDDAREEESKEMDDEDQDRKFCDGVLSQRGAREKENALIHNTNENLNSNSLWGMSPRNALPGTKHPCPSTPLSFQTLELEEKNRAPSTERKRNQKGTTLLSQGFFKQKKKMWGSRKTSIHPQGIESLVSSQLCLQEKPVKRRASFQSVTYNSNSNSNSNSNTASSSILTDSFNFNSSSDSNSSSSISKRDHRFKVSNGTKSSSKSSSRPSSGLPSTKTRRRSTEGRLENVSDTSSNSLLSLMHKYRFETDKNNHHSTSHNQPSAVKDRSSRGNSSHSNSTKNATSSMANQKTSRSSSARAQKGTRASSAPSSSSSSNTSTTAQHVPHQQEKKRVANYLEPTISSRNRKHTSKSFSAPKPPPSTNKKPSSNWHSQPHSNTRTGSSTATSTSNFTSYTTYTSSMPYSSSFSSASYRKWR